MNPQNEPKSQDSTHANQDAATLKTQPANVSTDHTTYLPEVWPGGFGLYKYSKQAVKLNLGIILVFWLLSVLLTGILRLTFGDTFLVNLAGFLVTTYFSAGLAIALLASIRDRQINASQVLEQCNVTLYLRYLVNTIVLLFILIGSSLLLIVPALFIMPRVILAPYLLIDRKLGPLSAINASWELTRGHAWMIWGVIAASIAMALPIVTIIGIPFSFYFLFMYAAALPIAYLFLSQPNTASVRARQAAAPKPPVEG